MSERRGAGAVDAGRRGAPKKNQIGADALSKDFSYLAGVPISHKRMGWTVRSFVGGLEGAPASPVDPGGERMNDE